MMMIINTVTAEKQLLLSATVSV